MCELSKTVVGPHNWAAKIIGNGWAKKSKQCVLDVVWGKLDSIEWLIHHACNHGGMKKLGKQGRNKARAMHTEPGRSEQRQMFATMCGCLFQDKQFQR